MESFYDFQTRQIKRQHAHVHKAFAIRQRREAFANQQYWAGHITHSEFEIRMKQIRDEYMSEEQQSVFNYMEAIQSYHTNSS